MEAAARALGEVAALDEHDVEAAQRGVPRDAGAGRAAADHQDLGLERVTSAEARPGAAAAGRAGRELTARGLRSSSASNQSKVRVTAFFQYL